MSGVGIGACDKLVVDVEGISLFERVSSDGRSTVALWRLPDHRHVVLPDVLHVQVGWLRWPLCNSRVNIALLASAGRHTCGVLIMLSSSVENNARLEKRKRTLDGKSAMYLELFAW